MLDKSHSPKIIFTVKNIFFNLALRGILLGDDAMMLLSKEFKYLTLLTMLSLNLS